MRISDWSSDVCSSDLHLVDEPVAGRDLVVDDERRRLLVVAHLQVLATAAPGHVGRRQPDGGERLDGEGLGDDLPGHIRLDRARELAAGSAEAAPGRPDAALQAHLPIGRKPYRVFRGYLVQIPVSPGSITTTQ